MHQRQSDNRQQKRRLAEVQEPSNATARETAVLPPRLFSVIIPALHEEYALPETLAHLNVFRQASDVIVVDGGSQDNTVRVAQEAGARVVLAAPGRGPQMNAGAQAAVHDNLLFLHADCRLPDDAFRCMDEIFDCGRSAGLFAINFGSPHPILRMMSRLSQWPTRWTQFGEGALFMQRQAFEEVGGFPDWPLMEDVEMLRRLRRTSQLGYARGVVRASPRRFVENGVCRQTLRNFWCYTLFHLGVPPASLLRWYTGGRFRSVSR